MTFSIITPSYNSSPWLQLCVASVADQGVDLEHIVQDACSTDGTLDWAPRDSRIHLFVEKDRGMYDAINKGLKKAKGEILAYLNCDEQFLPGALQSVQHYFSKNPGTDILFADAFIINADGQFIAFRKAVLPRPAHTLVGGCLAVLTCATFFRRNIIEQGCWFNPDLKNVGDAEWVLRLIKARFRMGLLRQYTSAFTETGQNLSLNPNLVAELKTFQSQGASWHRKAKKLIDLHHHFRRAWRGAYFQRALDYSIFTLKSPAARQNFHVQKPNFRWNR